MASKSIPVKSRSGYQNDPVLQWQYRDHIPQYLQDRYDYFNDLKASAGCQHCGESDPRCLAYHHVDPKLKRFAISKGIRNNSYGLFILLDEVSKCIVLCHNCHAKVEHPLTTI